jgi:bile acid-coenzyme A ligase
MSSGPIPFGTRIHQLAEEHGDEPAIIYLPEDGSERVVTWTELDERSTQLARALAAKGIGQGDRFGIKLRNSPEHYFASFAGWKLGAVVVPIRWDLPEWELERVRGVLEAKFVLEPTDVELIEGSRSESTEPLPDAIAPNARGILSSGSTGSPKVILNNAPGVWMPGGSANMLIEAYGPLSRPQLILVPAPLYHNNGFMSTSNLLGGDRLVLLERFNGARILEAIEKYKITGFIATTIMLQRIEREPESSTRDLSSIEWVMHGAAPLPDWLAKRWIELIGPKQFYVCYGSSEGAGSTFANGDEYLQHAGTVGKGSLGTQLRILDDDGNDVPQGEIGAIYMKSAYGLMASYVGNVAPIPVTEDGFASVGDLGWLDEDGYLFLADRRVDMIISGGANVYPAEVESAVSEHPGVSDVVVIGLSDPEWGRRVHAIVQPMDPANPVSPEEIIAWCKERLSPYKVPKSIEYVDSIPRSEATKINRATLIAEREGGAASS